jgi:CBS domain-containing protein
MLKEIPRVHPEDPLGKALQVLLTTEVHHLPVVDRENRVVGILTRSDFLKLIFGRG